MPETLRQGRAVSREPLPEFTRLSLEQWCAGCRNFLQWEREHILQAEPSSQDQQAHRQTLQWLLRLTRLIHSVASDPEFPHRSTTELVEVVLWQLEQSWKMIYEPLPVPEAETILAEIFPDES